MALIWKHDCRWIKGQINLRKKKSIRKLKTTQQKQNESKTSQKQKQTKQNKNINKNREKKAQNKSKINKHAKWVLVNIEYFKSLSKDAFQLQLNKL